MLNIEEKDCFKNHMYIVIIDERAEIVSIGFCFNL